jgi:hypothetical protein
MNDMKTRMIRKAERMHKKIFPCAEKADFDDCFTKNNDFVFFWYNTEDHSTHVITESLHKNERKRVTA